MNTQTATAGVEPTVESVVNGTAKAPRVFTTIETMKIELDVIADNKLKTVAGLVAHGVKIGVAFGGVLLVVGGIAALVVRGTAETVAAVTDAA